MIDLARRHLAILLLVSACAPAVASQSPGARPSDAAAPALDPTRFEAEIRAFEAADRASPPPVGAVIFVGSSSIKNWTDVAADFPGVPVLNCGFGGSTLAEVVYYADRIVLRYRQWSALPAARLAFVSIKPSPSRRAYIDRARQTNQRIGATRQPRPELFLADSLHMTRAGYLLWRALLAPVVR